MRLEEVYPTVGGVVTVISTVVIVTGNRLEILVISAVEPGENRQETAEALLDVTTAYLEAELASGVIVLDFSATLGDGQSDRQYHWSSESGDWRASEL